MNASRQEDLGMIKIMVAMEVIARILEVDSMT